MDPSDFFLAKQLHLMPSQVRALPNKDIEELIAFLNWEASENEKQAKKAARKGK